MNDANNGSAVMLLRAQRSHILLVLSHPREGMQSQFLTWFAGEFRATVSSTDGVLSVQLYEQHEIDIQLGQFPRLPLRYLGVCHLSVDGAEKASGLIEKIAKSHSDQPAALPPATWLYYPSCEKVGRPPELQPCMLAVAFANGILGKEQEFREFYATRHIRHALNLAPFKSGQCFTRTAFQQPGAMPARFDTVAIYEQHGSPEEVIGAAAALPKGMLDFPLLDLKEGRFAEWVYRPL